MKRNGNPKSAFYKGYKLRYCWCGYPTMRWMVLNFFDDWQTTCDTLLEAKIWVEESLSMSSVEYKRPPTKAEIAFGYGATHYLNIPGNICMKEDGTLKLWLINPTDGLRYTRSYRNSF